MSNKDHRVGTEASHVFVFPLPSLMSLLHSLSMKGASDKSQARFLLHFMSISSTQPSLLRLNTGALLFNFTLGLKGIKINIRLHTAQTNPTTPTPTPAFSQPHSAYSADGRSIIDDDSLFLPISPHVPAHFQALSRLC